MHDTQPSQSTAPEAAPSPPAHAPDPGGTPADGPGTDPLPARVRDALAQSAAASDHLVCTIAPDGTVEYVNAAGLALLGARTLDDVRGRGVDTFLAPEERARLDGGRHALLDDHSPGTWRDELRLYPIDGAAPVHVEVRATAVRDDATGALVAVAATMRDVGGRERWTEQASHAQRVESLGVLAGGVAHDFNNLLTVILSTIDLVRGDLPRGHPLQADLDVVRGAAARAGQLTRQLLAFTRRGALDVRPLDLNAVVADAQGLLRRLVGEDTTLDVSLTPRPLPVRADAAQLEQVLVNLVINARDAVARRAAASPPAARAAVVTIETGETTLGAEGAARYGVPTGRYVCVVVHDTGVGTDDTTRGRSFEPFVTARPLGQGTGLGLATVQGIVTRAGGVVDVESRPARGGTFRVLLPRAEPAEERRPAVFGGAPEAAEGPPRGRETVLLVEDEAAVRGVARRILERVGYTVLEARHGADALLVWREQGGARSAIDVLLTDVRMPELGGRELAAALRRERPDLPVVFVSGYLQEPASRASEAPPSAPGRDGDRFVAKPFVAPDLQRAVRQALDGARTAA